MTARFCPTSKTSYDHKRNEGKSHKQAIFALARRRLDVLWALIRDHRTFTTAPQHPLTHRHNQPHHVTRPLDKHDWETVLA